MGIAGLARGEMSVNLPENSDSVQQQAVLDALPALVFLQREGSIVSANAEARLVLGLAEAAWVPRPTEDLLWGLFPGTAEPQTLLAGSERARPFHATLAAAGGHLLPVEGTYRLLSAELREAVIVAHLSDREQAPKSRLMEDVLASIPEAIVIVHGVHVLYTNPAFTQMFGYTAEEVSGGNLREFIVPETRQHENAMLQKMVDEYSRAAMETVRQTKDGELVDVSLMAAPLAVGGANVGYVLTYRDIGMRKQMEARLQYDAMHDALTGLPNRALFLDRLTLAMNRRARRRDQNCGVLFLDLDRFKEINDTLGHAAGDLLLVAVAKRLNEALRPHDTAARLGGDEFAVVVENILDASDLCIVATRVLREMLRPFEIFGNPVFAGASIGAAMAGPDHAAPELLIRDADFAMYRAKQGGGNRFEIFDRRLEVHASSLQEREQGLRAVLDKREFELWYQPIYRLINGKLEGFESLLRRRRADGSFESFRELLSVAEDTGLSISIGRETMNDVCRQLLHWAAVLPEVDLTLTVNLSSRQFYHPDMVAQLRSVLATTGARPSSLLFEMSESTLSDNPDAAVAILQRMIDCNVRVAIDNFGSNLAPLNHLVRLPIDMVKLDSKLTMTAATGGRHAAILESLIHLGRSLGVRVVAQGIETLDQLNALRRMGCELGQGHLLSRAVEPNKAQRLAEQGYWIG